MRVIGESQNNYFGQFFFRACRKMGSWQASAYKFISVWYSLLSKLGFKMKGKEFLIYAKSLKHPVYCRFGTSDFWVFIQLFIEEEYSRLGKVESPNLIIDCGANVGYSSAYFLNKYPQAHVIAVEPDSDNFNLCCKNLAPYSKRVSLVHSAIWSNKVGLVICRDYPDDCNEWGISVRACREGEIPDLWATDIGSLIEESEFNNIDILKVDIEKSESVVFSCNYDWLDKVKYIAIELHGKECEEAFFKALSSQQYDSWSSGGELTFCKINSNKKYVPM